MKMYVFEQADGVRYVRQYKTLAEAEAHAAENNVKLIER